jgi:maltooligosyltrehalose synthase
VDFAERRQALAELDAWNQLPAGERRERVSQLGQSLANPRLKLFVTRTLLALRQQRFQTWIEYVPLEASGPMAEHLIAFGWRNAETHQIELIAAVPRFLHKLTQQAEAVDRGWCLSEQVWSGTTVQVPAEAGGVLQSMFTASCCGTDDGALAVGRLLQEFPLVVLEPADNLSATGAS